MSHKILSAIYGDIEVLPVAYISKKELMKEAYAKIVVKYF